MSSVHNDIDINMPNLTNMHDLYKQSLFSLVKPTILKILNKYVQTAIHPFTHLKVTNCFSRAFFQDNLEFHFIINVIYVKIKGCAVRFSFDYEANDIQLVRFILYFL